MNTIKKVAEFHKAFGVSIPSEPTNLVGGDSPLYAMALHHLQMARDYFRASARCDSKRAIRMALESEELLELGDALNRSDLAAALDAQVDRRYIADGTTLALGMAGVFDEAFERVHAANMAKLGPDGKAIIDAAGKIQKPEGWVAPDLRDLVKR